MPAVAACALGVLGYFSGQTAFALTKAELTAEAWLFPSQATKS